MLEEVQWAHDPKQALSQESDRDGAIVAICLRLIERLSTMPAPEPAADRDDARGRLAAEPVRLSALSIGEAGEPVDVPPLPAEFVDRAEIAVACARLLGEGTGAVGVTGRGLGLHGQGGIGKTVLATAIARNEHVLQHFPDGVLWVSLGEGADIVAAQRALLNRLGSDAEVRTTIEAKAALSRALAERRCLLVVDDVWSGDAAVAFRVTGSRGRVLYTSRYPMVLKAAGADAVPVDVLPEQAARELLANLAGETIETLPAEADAVLTATKRVALSIALVGAAVGRGGTSWPALVEQLKHGAKTYLAHPYADVFKAMQVAVAALPATEAEVYHSLAVYPQDTKVPVDAVACYWTHLWGYAAEETQRQLRTLAERELLSLADETITFHDLQRDFLLLRADDLALLHGELLAAYRTLLPANDSGWAQLPGDEPYIWEHLLYHLQGAGDGNAIIALVTDLAYLARRCLRSGPYATESDLHHGADLYPNDPAVGWLLRLFTQHGHSFTCLSTVADLAATLWSHTQHAPAEISRTSLGPLLPKFYLEPRWGLREAPPTLTRVLEGHTGSVNRVAFSPDGTLLATAGEDPAGVRTPRQDELHPRPARRRRAPRPRQSPAQQKRAAALLGRVAA